MNLIEIGYCVKIRGFKGEIVIETNINNVSCLKNLNFLIFENKYFKITNFKNLGNRFGVQLAGIDNEILAKSFLGKVAFCNKEEVILSENEYFLEDLIDFLVYDNKGNFYGKIIEAENYGANDFYTVKNNKKEYSFTSKENLFVKIDIENKMLILDSEIMKEVWFEN